MQHTVGSNDLLAQLGVYFQPEFLSPEECARLIAVFESGALIPAAVYGDAEGSRVDRAQRRTGELPSKGLDLGWLEERFERLRPALEEHFGEALSAADRPTLLAYDQGDFFLPHRDKGASRDSGKPEIQTRKVTVLVHLNRQDSGPEEQPTGDYGGGALTIYGYLKVPGTENHGFPVQGFPGLLVAFRAGDLHGVTEVTRGRRYCAVTWYH